ncbi:hypothetical protein SAMD00023519_00064 [Listeria monocytogenes]|nr:hypothetical protein SAMD00023518_00436 [Listeria monocytogenes]GAT37907.1 hypothetical protein SAMD00023519_00064 [Listeria monocytogenes]
MTAFFYINFHFFIFFIEKRFQFALFFYHAFCVFHFLFCFIHIVTYRITTFFFTFLDFFTNFFIPLFHFFKKVCHFFLLQLFIVWVVEYVIIFSWFIFISS